MDPEKMSAETIL